MHALLLRANLPLRIAKYAAEALLQQPRRSLVGAVALVGSLADLFFLESMERMSGPMAMKSLQVVYVQEMPHAFQARTTREKAHPAFPTTRSENGQRQMASLLLSSRGGLHCSAHELYVTSDFVSGGGVVRDSVPWRGLAATGQGSFVPLAAAGGWGRKRSTTAVPYVGSNISFLGPARAPASSLGSGMVWCLGAYSGLHGQGLQARRGLVLHAASTGFSSSSDGGSHSSSGDPEGDPHSQSQGLGRRSGGHYRLYTSSSLSRDSDDEHKHPKHPKQRTGHSGNEVAECHGHDDHHERGSHDHDDHHGRGDRRQPEDLNRQQAHDRHHVHDHHHHHNYHPDQKHPHHHPTPPNQTHHHHPHDHSTDEHHHHHHHSPGHDHNHGYSLDDPNLTTLQHAILKAATALRLAPLADALRDNLPVALSASGLLAAAVATPFFAPVSVVPALTKGLVGSVFALLSPPALLDLVLDLAGGRVNIHVLMSLAAFASVAMGSAVEGALLLCLFNVAHTAEDVLTRRAQSDVWKLEELSPDTAICVTSYDPTSPPPMSDLALGRVPVRDVDVGSYVLVRAGEVAPLDGEVVEGKSSVTVEHLTGESIPVVKTVGDKVPGGARNTDGILIVKVSRSWADSTVQRIVRLTEQAQATRPHMQKWLDRFGDMYSCCVMAAAVGVAVLGPVVAGWPVMTSGGVTGSVYRALGVMVAAAPCALVMVPLAYVAAISACARRGVLLKGGQALDALASCSTIAFDKTGTLTTGELQCTVIQPIHGHNSSNGRSVASNGVAASGATGPKVLLARDVTRSEGSLGSAADGTVHGAVAGDFATKDGRDASVTAAAMDGGDASLQGVGVGVRTAVTGTYAALTQAPCCSPSCQLEALAVAAALEQAATHPIARAVREYSVGKVLPMVAVEGVQTVAGEGLRGTVTRVDDAGAMRPSDMARIGSVEYVVAGQSSADAFEIQQAASTAAAAASSSDSVIAALGVGDKVTLFHFQDRLRDRAAEVVGMLRRRGLRTLMLTGDHPASAQKVAEEVGLDEVYSSLKPEDKLRKVEELVNAHGGKGLVMVGDGINDAPALAKATVGIVLADHASATAVAAADVLILQNEMDGIPFVVAKASQTVFLVKQSVALALVCILGACLPAVTGVIPLWLTVVLHEGSTVLVCLNALRALRDPPSIAKASATRRRQAEAMASV